jgi:hypothetical protein
MTTATEMTESVQDGVLKAIEVGQRLTVEAVSAAASTFEGVLPARASTAAAATAPWTEGLISPKELIETSFRFTERVLESQKAFLAELVTITTPPTTSTGSTKKPATA